MPMFGICAYNLVAIRAEASDKSELVTQLLFGDLYTVEKESENGKWLEIKVVEDGYVGWMDKKLFFDVSEDYSKQWLSKPRYVCADSIGFVSGEGFQQPIFFGSYLPLFDGHYVYLGSKGLSFKGTAQKLEQGMQQNILHHAQTFLHTPYLWGGKSHAGIDCSGLVQIVFRNNGHKLQRDAWQQASMGSPVENIEEAKSCDLAFFSNDAGRVTHVGILLGPQDIIHAHGKVRKDKIDHIGIINGDTGLYSHRLSGIRRIVHESKQREP